MMSEAAEHESSSTSSSLLVRLREQDPDAWGRLTEIYGPLVYGWARRGGLQNSDAADVSQEVFRVVATRIATFRKEGPADSFRGWLWGITRNKLKECFRHQTIGCDGAGGSAAHQRMQELSESLPDDVSQLESESSRGRLLRRAMMTVEPEFEQTTWRAFWRMTVDQQKATDIADELGLSSAAVRQAKYRVLRRLRQELDQLL